MISKIIEALNKENVAVWRINSTKTKRAELYFVKKNLDIPRLAQMQEYEVNVYRDFEESSQKFRGVSTCFIEQDQDPCEIQTKIKNAYFAAQFVKNKFYELPSPVKADKKPSSSDLAGKDVCDIANAFADTVLSLPTDDVAFVNSLEIFVIHKECRIVCSTGTDVSYDEDLVKGEYVTQCKSPLDVEQFRDFAFNTFDTQSLKKAVLSAIDDAKKRANAKGNPKKGTYNVILTGKNLEDFFYYYLARGNASTIFPGYSTWKTGDKVSADNLNIDLVATTPYSADGIEMKDLSFLKDGVLKNITGPTRFMRYLNQEPSGSFEKFRVSAGTMNYSDMKKEGTLETIMFSDFQMDIFTGNFGGEMRLATITQNGKEVPLSGGSINGKVSDIDGKLIFSKEMYEDNHYSGPFAVLIPNVPVAGV